MKFVKLHLLKYCFILGDKSFWIWDKFISALLSKTIVHLAQGQDVAT